MYHIVIQNLHFFSLGGKSKMTIITNVSPSNYSIVETLYNLKFAQREKIIWNTSSVTEDATRDVITLMIQIQQLKEEVSHMCGYPEEVPPTQEYDYGNMALLTSFG